MFLLSILASPCPRRCTLSIALVSTFAFKIPVPILASIRRAQLQLPLPLTQHRLPSSRASLPLDSIPWQLAFTHTLAVTP